MDDIRTLFESFEAQAAAAAAVKDDIRASTQAIDQAARGIEAALQQCHSTLPADAAPFLAATRLKFAAILTAFRELRQKFPQEQYYKYNGLWRHVTQQVCYLAALLVFLESQALITIPQLTALTGLTQEPDSADGLMFVELDDFLMGVCLLPQELARLAINSVTLGDYERPLRISAFLGELHSGFRQLNLKNDGLRKRFDSIKYDVKKVENVTYDLSLRGLSSPQQQGAAAPASASASS